MAEYRVEMHRSSGVSDAERDKRIGAAFDILLAPLDFDKRMKNRESREPKSPYGAGTVYLIHNPDTGLYKIGLTTQVGVRLGGLRTQYGKRLQMARKWHTSSMLRTEQELHARFSEKRQHGEWFALDDGDLTWLALYQADDPPEAP